MYKAKLAVAGAFIPLGSSSFVFVCVEVLRPSQSNVVMSSAVSLLNHFNQYCALFCQKLTTTILESGEGRE